MNYLDKLYLFLKGTRTFLFIPLILVGLILPATAQEEEDEDLEIYQLDSFEITSGFAGSLAFATETKQRAPVIIEAVSAEDIGKLPDSSIAETLARLPGLTTQRVNSRAQGIAIRGLTGDFSTALLNGRQQVSASGGRSVEFDQYPAELLNSVVVYKSTQPNLVGQGLAGTVDMQTVRPLEHGKKTLAMNAFYEWADLGNLNPDGEDTGHRYSINYIDQNEDETIGWAFGYAKTDQPGQGEQWNAWGFPTNDDGDFFLGGAKPFVRSSVLDRDSFMGVLEFKPSDRVHSTFDVFFSDFNETQILRGIEMPIFPGWGTGTTIEPGSVVERGLVTQATLSGFYGVMRNDVAWRDAEVFAPGWNLKVGEGDGWIFELDLSRSEIDRTDNILETYSGWGSNKGNSSDGGTEADWSMPDTVTYTLGGSTGATFSTGFDYSSPNIRLAGPQGWGGGDVPGGQVGFFKGPESNDELSQAKASMSRYLNGFFTDVEFGVAYTDRAKSEFDPAPNGREGWFLQLANGDWSAPLPPTIGNADLSFIGIGPQIAYDPRQALADGVYNLIPNNNPSLIANDFNVDEEITTGYVQFGINTKMGDIPVKGTIGTQVIRTDQSSVGPAATNSGGQLVVETVSGEHSYTDFVPSLNLVFELNETNNLRFSAARQLARQAMFNMRASSSFGFNEALADSTDIQLSPWSGDSGNPALEPWRSNSFDLSFEHYFADNMGYWSLAGFYKDLVSYTFTESVLSDFTGFPTGVDGVTPVLNQGFRNSPQNGSGGSIKGFEFSLSLPGEKFSDAFEGWGLLLNGSFTDSSITPNPGNPSEPIPGLSEEVINATIYYEKNGFAARASSRYRSDFRGDIATFGPRGAVFRNVEAESVLDAQISYTFESGSLEGLTLILQGYNLTDEPLSATFGDQDSRLVQDYQSWGAQYSVGASYKF